MIQTWRDRVRAVYFSLDELKAYDRVYNIARRCGFKTAEDLWNTNPVIGGSTKPSDFGLARGRKSGHGPTVA
jgi:hypothetical protein